MTTPNPNDLNSIAGTHPGVKSQQEIANNISFDIDNTKSLKDVANQLINSADWNLNSLSDPNTSPKYAIDPEISYYGNGSLSLNPSLGKLTFSAKTNEDGPGAFSLNQAESNFFSNLVNTTLGSLKIATVDGQELNPLSPTIPSTNFSPTKPWVKKLIPTFSDGKLMTIAVLSLVSKELDRLDKKLKPENSDRKQDTTDMATIIVDNQIIEDQLFTNP